MFLRYQFSQCKVTIMDISKLAGFIGVLAIVIYCVKQYSNGCECDSKADLKGKVIIVTGANTGIGKETALELVKRNGRVIMACRSLERCSAAASDIKEETGATDQDVICMELDLGSLASIRRFVEDFNKKEKKLHILINNAGLWSPDKAYTVDGFEQTFGVNHLGPFLLTNLLLDVMKKSAPSRIVTVSSQGQDRPWYQATLNFTDLMYEETTYGGHPAYTSSKLANVLFSAELAERLGGTGVTTYSLHPGVIVTEIARNAPMVNNFPIKQIVEAFLWPITKDIYHGAQTQIYCAVSEKLAMDSGKYYSDCAEKLPSKNGQNMEDARRLWDISAKLVGL